MKLGLFKTLLTTGFLISQLSFAGLIESDIGKGIYRFDREAGLKDRCIQLESTETFEQDVRHTSFTLDLVTSKEELYDKISFKGSANGSYGAFSAEAKTKFVKEVKWNFSSNYVLVKATRITKQISISKPNILLTEYSKNLMLDSKFKFLQACGDSFASTVNLGGEVYGLIEIQANNYQEKQEIESSLSASGSYSGAKASGSMDYKRLIEKLSSSYKVKVTFQHIGGRNIEMPQTVEGLLISSTQIEEHTDYRPVPVSIETRDYLTLSNYVFDNSIEEKIRQENISWAEGKLKHARNIFSQIVYILKNPKDFKNVDEIGLKSKLNYLDDKIIEIKKFIAKSSSFLNESDISTLKMNLLIELPEMKRRAAKNELKVTCETKRSNLCGIETYKEMKSAACGTLGPKTGKGPVCGTIYKEAETIACGVKHYNLKEDVKCGALQFKQCHHKSCGTEWNGARKRCRAEGCGAETYKTCEDPSFGNKEFFKCRDEKHGVEDYLTCQDKEFGYDFESCAHISHGAATFNICEIAKVGSQETFCPEF